MNHQQFTIISILVLLYNISLAQTIHAKIVDKKTNESIPYAIIELSENNELITNEEGKFSITIDKKNPLADTIYISSMGYEKTPISLQNITDSIIYIHPKVVELKSVFITNKKLTIDEIIHTVKDSILKNYNFNLTKKRLFFRESNTNHINKIRIKFKKSTIAALHKKLIDSVVKVLPEKSEFYSEVLCDFYGNVEKQKMLVVKGARLYDKNNEGSIEALFKKVEKIFKKNVKSNSYLKIKSGIFSQKIQVDSILNTNNDATDIKDDLEKENSKGNFFFTSRKMNIKNLFADLFFQKDTKLNVIRKSGKYNFKNIDYTTIDDNGVYVISFSPNRGAPFKGVLYVNTEDFSVMRIDYENVKPLRKLKLLGLSYEAANYQGKTFFAKGKDGKYSPRFIEKVTANIIGIDRPLKIIEKNKYVKGRNRQNELSLDLDIINTNKNKYEIIIFDSQKISEKTYASKIENKNKKAVYLSEYQPEFWKGHTTIEPNTAIKEFTTSEKE